MNTQKAISVIRKLHSAITQDTKDALKHAIRIGEILAQQKKELGHGNFQRWIKSDYPL